MVTTPTKSAAVNPIIRASGDSAMPRGDEVQPMLMRNPYQMDPERALQYENGYEWALSLGHRTLGQATPDDIERWARNPQEWREGFAAAAGRLGMGNVRDTLLERTGTAMDPLKTATLKELDYESLSMPAKLAANTMRNLARVGGGLGGAALGVGTVLGAGALGGAGVGELFSGAGEAAESIAETAAPAAEATEGVTEAATDPGLISQAGSMVARSPWLATTGAALAGYPAALPAAGIGAVGGLAAAEGVNRTLFAPSPRNRRIR